MCHKYKDLASNCPLPFNPKQIVSGPNKKLRNFGGSTGLGNPTKHDVMAPSSVKTSVRVQKKLGQVLDLTRQSIPQLGLGEGFLTKSEQHIKSIEVLKDVEVSEVASRETTVLPPILTLEAGRSFEPAATVIEVTDPS